MLEIGKFAAQTCGGLNRRAFLRLGTSLPLAVGVPAPARTTFASTPHKGQAKSVIFVWLWGAPSHIDTFDPKPDAPSEVRGPFSSINTRTPGLQLTELLPRLANCSNLFTVVRSHVTFAGGHPDAGTFGLTGFAERPAAKPSFGSIMSKHRGQLGPMSPYVMLGRGVPKDIARSVEGYGGGSLGRGFDPIMMGCSEMGEVEIPQLKLLDGISPHRIQDRWSLLRSMDDARTEFDRASSEWSRLHARAYQLLTQPEARTAIDLTRESTATRDAYGQTAFGQSCLMARRYHLRTWFRNGGEHSVIKPARHLGVRA